MDFTGFLGGDGVLLRFLKWEVDFTRNGERRETGEKRRLGVLLRLGLLGGDGLLLRRGLERRGLRRRELSRLGLQRRGLLRVSTHLVRSLDRLG